MSPEKRLKKLLPTPKVDDGHQRPTEYWEKRSVIGKEIDLQGEIQMQEKESEKLLPTPRSQDAKHGEATDYEKNRGRGKDLLHVGITREPEESMQSPQLPLLPADSLASLYLKPGSEEARQMTAGSGQRCLESYQRSSPLGSLQKMLLDSSRWGSGIVYLTWKVKVMKSRHLLFQLVPSMPRTGEIESSLWATPNTLDGMNPKSPKALWKEATEDRRNRSKPGNLRDQVSNMKMWPTPSATERSGINPKTGRGQGLGKTVKEKSPKTLFSTPSANEDAAGTPEGKMQKMLGNSPEIRESGTGSLNPNFVEFLMNFPKDWTVTD